MNNNGSIGSNETGRSDDDGTNPNPPDGNEDVPAVATTTTTTTSSSSRNRHDCNGSDDDDEDAFGRLDPEYTPCDEQAKKIYEASCYKAAPNRSEPPVAAPKRSAPPAANSQPRTGGNPPHAPSQPSEKPKKCQS